MLRLVISAVLAGLALGLFSVVGDRLPAETPLHVIVALANAASPWLATAFAIGAAQADPRRGATASSLALVVALGVYYLGIYVGGNQVANLGRVLGAWLAVSVIAGPILGACGAWWSSARPPGRALAVSLLGGLLLAEAGQRLIQVEIWTGIDLARSDVQVALVNVVAALLAPVLLLRRSERGGYVASIPIGIAGIGVVFAVTLVIRALIVG